MMEKTNTIESIARFYVDAKTGDWERVFEDLGLYQVCPDAEVWTDGAWVGEALHEEPSPPAYTRELLALYDAHVGDMEAYLDGNGGGWVEYIDPEGTARQACARVAEAAYCFAVSWASHAVRGAHNTIESAFEQYQVCLDEVKYEAGEYLGALEAGDREQRGECACNLRGALQALREARAWLVSEVADAVPCEKGADALLAAMGAGGVA